MEDNASNSNHSGISLFTLSSHMIPILVANVYVNNLEEWLLQGSLLLCCKKMKNSKISTRLEAASIECSVIYFKE